MKRLFVILSFIPAAVTGLLFTFGTNGEFFHLFWLMPLCGLIAGALSCPVLILWHPGTAALFMLVSGMLTGGLHPISLSGLMIGAAALFELIGYGVGAFGKTAIRGKTFQKIGAGFAVLLLLAVLFIPNNAVFGNPVSALMAKHQFDGCMEAHVDPERYTPHGMVYYDWYNGNYKYRLTDKLTGKSENLSLYKNRDEIYFSGTNRSYENIWN